MSENYQVQSGDCVSSIAYKRGFFWQTLWDHPNNADLKNTRKDPNVLQQGDSLFIPDLTPKNVDCATDAKYKFKLKGVPGKIKLCLMTNNQPRKNIPYILVIDGKSYNGQTDSKGCLEHSIPPDASSGKLIINNPNGYREERRLNLGELNPYNTVAGGKDRLANLGYDCAKDGNDVTDNFTEAVKGFQGDQKLPVTGNFDDATQQKLKQIHGF